MPNFKILADAIHTACAIVPSPRQAPHRHRPPPRPQAARSPTAPTLAYSIEPTAGVAVISAKKKKIQNPV
jgi:hypothetical protein